MEACAHRQDVQLLARIRRRRAKLWIPRALRATRITATANDVFAAHLYGFRVGLAGFFAMKTTGDASPSRKSRSEHTKIARGHRPINVTDLQRLFSQSAARVCALNIEVTQHGLISTKESGKAHKPNGERETEHGDVLAESGNNVLARHPRSPRPRVSVSVLRVSLLPVAFESCAISMRLHLDREHKPWRAGYGGCRNDLTPASRNAVQLNDAVADNNVTFVSSF